MKRSEVDRRKKPNVVAWFLSAHDLVLAKLAAGRENDLEFAEQAILGGLVDRRQLELGLDLMPDFHREVTRERLEGLIARIDRTS